MPKSIQQQQQALPEVVGRILEVLLNKVDRGMDVDVDVDVYAAVVGSVCVFVVSFLGLWGWGV